MLKKTWKIVTAVFFLDVADSTARGNTGSSFSCVLSDRNADKFFLSGKD